MYKGLWSILAAFALCACAVIEPPSGGPEDKDPPAITGIIPANDSAGVSRDARVTIEFSEKVDGASFKNRVVTYPPVEFEDIRTDGNLLELVFREDLPETTICVMLRGGFKDHHKVENRASYKFFFSTAERMDRGTITGKILFKQQPDSSGVAMLVNVTPGDTLGELYAEDESRTAYSDGFGNYLFRALPTDGSAFRVWAFIDKDGDGRYSFGKEFAMEYPDTIILSGSMTGVRGIDINVIDPDEPGTVEGTLVDLTGSGVPALIRLDRTGVSSAYFAARADSTGAFRFPAVRPGAYVLTAFIDIAQDSIPGDYRDPADSTLVLPEPFAVYPDTLSMDPGGSLTLEPLELRREE